MHKTGEFIDTYLGTTNCTLTYNVATTCLAQATKLAPQWGRATNTLNLYESGVRYTATETGSSELNMTPPAANHAPTCFVYSNFPRRNAFLLV